MSTRCLPLLDRPRDDKAHVRPRVCVIGSGTRFLSGISYYTHRLASALSEDNDVSVVLMRRLVPSCLYPGRKRVGHDLANFRYPPDVPVFDGVDWYWLPSVRRAAAFLRSQHPEIVVLQWWTGAVLHSFLLLIGVARRMGARVVIEFHEVQDVGETAIPLTTSYVNLLAPRLLRAADAAVAHSEWDRAALSQRYGMHGLPVALVPHGPYGGFAPDDPDSTDAEPGTCRLLYFGVIRPFKGLEDLIRAFDAMSPEEARRFHLTVVGETWEGWRLPARLISASPHRDRITFVNRYVDDDEVGRYFAGTDAVVLPYHRSSSSGPLHIAMSHGLPVLVTTVGGLTEAARDYQGAVFVPPGDLLALRDGLTRVAELRGRRFTDPHSWTRTAELFGSIFASLLREPSLVAPSRPHALDGDR